MLKKILIKSRRLVFGDMSGDNTTILKGDGYDFVELREYEDGEDVKKIDWTISAKLQKPYVKVFHSQRELNVSIVPILSGSTHFGTSKFKKDVIAEICAILGYSCIKQSDRFDSFIANDGLSFNTKKAKNIFSVQSMTQKVLDYDVLGKDTDYYKITSDLFKMVKRKSIIFLIGDFFDVASLDFRVLSKKHQVVAVLVRDKFEESPEKIGFANLLDPQSGKNHKFDINNSLIEKYKRKIAKNDHELYEKFQKSKINFCKIYTNEEPINKLLSVMRKNG